MLLPVIFVALCTFAARAENSERSEDSAEQSNENEEPRNYVEALFDCSIKYDVPPNYFTLILTGDAPEFPNAKCFVKCGLEGLHYLNDDGSLNEQVVRKVLHRYFPEPSDHEQAISTWLSCEDESRSEQYDDDSCDRAYNMFICYSDRINKHDVPEQH